MSVIDGPTANFAELFPGDDSGVLAATLEEQLPLIFISGLMPVITQQAIEQGNDIINPWE